MMLIAMAMVRHAASSFGFSQTELPRDDLVAISKLASSPKDADVGEIAVSVTRFLNAK